MAGVAQLQPLPLPAMTLLPQVIPFERAKVLLVGRGAQTFEQFQRPRGLAPFPRVHGEVRLRSVEATPRQRFLCRCGLGVCLRQCLLAAGLERACFRTSPRNFLLVFLPVDQEITDRQADQSE